METGGVNTRVVGTAYMEVEAVGANPLYIPAEHARLADEIERCHSQFQMLWERLEQVRVDRPYPDTKLIESPEPVRSTLAGQTAYQADQAQQLADRIELLRDSLDL